MNHDAVMLVAGGSGVSAMLSYLKSLLLESDENTQGKRIKFIWAARKEGLVREVVTANYLHFLPTLQLRIVGQRWLFVDRQGWRMRGGGLCRVILGGVVGLSLWMLGLHGKVDIGFA
jgi:hypothetical protein